MRLRPRGIPRLVITGHRSTRTNGRWELTDNQFHGFDGRFEVDFYLADTLISRETFHSETSAREYLEDRVKKHYEE